MCRSMRGPATSVTEMADAHFGLSLVLLQVAQMGRSPEVRALALRSEIKKRRDLLTKLEEKQHKIDSRKKASTQRFIFEFGIKGV